MDLLSGLIKNAVVRYSTSLSKTGPAFDPVYLANAHSTSLVTSLYITGVGAFCRYFELFPCDRLCCPKFTGALRDKCPRKNRRAVVTAYSRRNFLKTGATVAAASLLASSSLRVDRDPGPRAGQTEGTAARARRLADGWARRGRCGIAKRSASGSRSRCRIASTRTTATT